MNEIKEIKIPKGVESIAVKQYDGKIVIEFVSEKPKFKEGDFVYEDGRIMIVKSYTKSCHAIVYHGYSDKVCYNSQYGLDFSEPVFRHATEEEKQLLIDAMKEDGKCWNADKKFIEDIPKRKFKAGDKVRIKDGISSKTHRSLSPNFTSTMDEFIGKKLIVERYNDRGFVVFLEDRLGFNFHEDWLEPYTEELKKGDLAIFWDYGTSYAIIRVYDRKDNKNHYDSTGYQWENAIKFESKEQFEKVLRGEI